MPIILLFTLLLFSYFVKAEPINPMSFNSKISEIPSSAQNLMQQFTWRPECPVPLEQLAHVSLSYWGFDQKTHFGILIVNKNVAKEVVDIFHELYLIKFPIAKMEPMDIFKGDDDASMVANNTSAFNCRYITGKPGKFSQHSYGRAIDINPLINPYIKGDRVSPLEGKAYIDRFNSRPGMIIKDDEVYNAFIKRGWIWGGDWETLKDYQHFEKLASP